MAESGVRSVGVLGCGQMGGGIAQVCATAGFETHVREVGAEPLERGMSAILGALDAAAERGRLSAEDRSAIEGRLHPTTDLADLAECDFVIEAVTEDLDLKCAVWRETDAAVNADAVFASNTSSLTIAAMAGATGRPDRFVGMHFFFPVPAMRLVEVVRTVTTSEEAFERATAFARDIGKEPIAAKDQSGFTVNLLLVPYLMDAIRAVERGVASIEDIDRGMQLGCGHPMGPLALCDLVGLDTLHLVAECMYAEHRESRYAPPPLLKRMTLVGLHGRKSGRGFYDYSTQPPTPLGLGV